MIILRSCHSVLKKCLLLPTICCSAAYCEVHKNVTGGSKSKPPTKCFCSCHPAPPEEIPRDAPALMHDWAVISVI